MTRSRKTKTGASLEDIFGQRVKAEVGPYGMDIG